jgi:acetyl-CoA acetyltransferase
VSKTRKRIAFVGCGYTPMTRTPTKPETELAIEACLMAAADAGFDPAEIDGINTQVHHWPPPSTAEIAQGVGMREVNWQREGGLGILSAGIAAEALDEGKCKAVLICKIMNTIAPVTTPKIDAATGRIAGPGQFEVPYGLGYSMQRIGLRARAYIHRYGVTQEQVGWICITQREHALMNSWAVHKRPLTMEQYLGSRWIAEPVRLLDCDMPVNGSFAYLMTTEDIARDLRQPPVYLASWASQPKGARMDHLEPEILKGMSPFAETLYRDAGLGPADMDIWFMYDGFSFLVLHWMENLGLVPRGEAGHYVDGGSRIRFDGKHPLNSHGGQLSEGRLHGHGHILEAVQQLRGNAGPRQAKNFNTAILSSVFPESGSAGILVRD